MLYMRRVFLGVPLAGKVPGIDFADALMYRMSERGNAPVFAGRKAGGRRAGSGQSAKKIPGSYHCRHTGRLFQDEQQAVDAVKAAGGADVMFTCLGAPKQERFMAGHLDELPVTLSCGLGGSLDVFCRYSTTRT